MHCHLTHRSGDTPDIMNDTTYMPALLACKLPASSKKQVLQELSDIAGTETGVCQRAILSALVTREKLGTTAVGNGIALPHATVDQLQQTTILVASLDQPVDFDSPDGRPIDIVSIVLGAPESQGSYLGAIRFVTDSLNQNADAIRGAQNIAQLEAAMAASREAAA